MQAAPDTVTSSFKRPGNGSSGAPVNKAIAANAAAVLYDDEGNAIKEVAGDAEAQDVIVIEPVKYVYPIYPENSREATLLKCFKLLDTNKSGWVKWSGVCVCGGGGRDVA